MYPMLMIGNETNVYKQQNPYSQIYTVTSVKDIRYIVDRFGGKSLDSLCVLEIYLNEYAQSCLLKFIEDADFPILILSYYDNVIPTLLSRMQTVIKTPLYPVNVGEFMSVNSIYPLYTEKFMYSDNEMDELIFMKDNCPKLFCYKYLGNTYNKKNTMRILNLIESL